jgi:predicted O-linked N-acetylglucosamine transferase (SPINDLY family)
MAELTILEALTLAVQQHQSGHLAEAEKIYRAVLQAEPQQVDALRLLGVIALQRGQYEPAITLIRQALHHKPDDAAAYHNLGAALQAQQRLTEARDAYQQAVHHKPDYAEAYNDLGIVLQMLGQTVEAQACFQQSLRYRPDNADAHNNLGVILHLQGQLAEAAACFEQALRLQPTFAETHANLGHVLKDQGKLGEAHAHLQQALRLKPDSAEAHNQLGLVFQLQGKLTEAQGYYQQALRLRPDYAEAHLNLGNVLRSQGQLDEAAACYQESLRCKPDYAVAFNNLGNILKDQGCVEEALSCYRQALQLLPSFTQAHSNLLYALHFCADIDAATLYEEHCRWDRQHAAPLAPFHMPHANDRSSDRRLRIGYVSPDFRQHPVGRFLLPLLQAHDHTRLEIYCYSSLQVPDAITNRCRAHADVWREVCGLTDEQLAQLIRQDRIDILVDLSMHMANNRLLVFARKPAPVQVTYLAYCGTTGLRAMDYRLTDPYLDPPDREERYYSERSIHLPETYWCYQPVDNSPPVNPLPARQPGQVTFACLNNFCKVTSPTLAAWSRLLLALPQARLLLHAQTGSHRDRVRRYLASQGIATERLRFVGRLPLVEYLRLYQAVDMALDPYPYGGGTTTCDALWMGVPVLSLAGPSAVSRGGLSILSNMGLAEWVAYDWQQYEQRAIVWAQDLPRLRDLRASLRQRMQNSPLMDAPRFARHVEAAYRRMWAS